MHSAREWFESFLDDSADVKVTDVLARELDAGEDIHEGHGARNDGRTRLGRRSRGVRNLRTRRDRNPRTWCV